MLLQGGGCHQIDMGAPGSFVEGDLLQAAGGAQPGQLSPAGNCVDPLAVFVDHRKGGRLCQGGPGFDRLGEWVEAIFIPIPGPGRIATRPNSEKAPSFSGRSCIMGVTRKWRSPSLARRGTQQRKAVSFTSHAVTVATGAPSRSQSGSTPSPGAPDMAMNPSSMTGPPEAIG